ncbi:MAG: hypothetical protein PHS57_08520, partial [Alphaproteobacteria bacterium]|nr:hypothetical protein [Alphaproteobacteria bacterium]
MLVLNQGGQQTFFDWQERWGPIAFSTEDDPVIPSKRLQPKADIKSVVEACAPSADDLSPIRAYDIDFDQDGSADFVIDASEFFTGRSNGCAVEPCRDGEGCYLSIYRFLGATNIVSGPSFASKDGEDEEGPAFCPQTAEQNVACEQTCPATEKNCPSFFEYRTKRVYNARVKGWTFISAEDFGKFAVKKPYRILNRRPVLAVTLSEPSCYRAELAANNNECIKYYQYSGDLFVDLFDYISPDENENTRDAFTYKPYARNDVHYARGTTVMGVGGARGFGHRLGSGATLDLQFPFFTRMLPGGEIRPPAFAVFHIVNASTKDYFIPVGPVDDVAFNVFMNNPPEGITISSDTAKFLRFTDWVGDTDCDAFQVPYGQTKELAAERFCQRATGTYASCQECIAAKVPGYENGCWMTKRCVGTDCVINDSAFLDGAGLSSYVGTTTRLQDCYDRSEFWTRYAAYGKDSPPDWSLWCQNHFMSLCNARETATVSPVIKSGPPVIALPNGGSKRLNAVRVGDMVLGYLKFDGDTIAVRVTQIMRTGKRSAIRINGRITLSPDQNVFLRKGRTVRAKDLKPGDILIMGNKQSLVVDTLATVPEKSEGIALNLDGGVGYIVDDVRLSSKRGA